jgi:hypothetical protein
MGETGTASVPLALNPALVVVVIAVFKVPSSVPHAASHRSDRQHQPTLTLFEILVQERRTSANMLEGMGV